MTKDSILLDLRLRAFRKNVTHDAMLEKHVYSPSTRVNVKSLTNNVTRRYMEK